METTGGGAIPVTEAPPSRQRWTVGLALAVNGLATTFPLVTIGLLLPGITGTFGLTNTQAGWLGSITTAGTLLVSVPAALLFGNISPYLLTGISVGTGAVFTFLHGAAPSFALLLLARLGFSLAFALRPASQALVLSRWFPAHEVPLVQGIIFGVLGAAEFGTLILTPKLLDVTGSWRVVYYIYGIASMGVAILWLLAGRGGMNTATAPLPRAACRVASPRSIFRHREVWLIGVATLCSGVSWWAYLTFWPTYMLAAHGVSLAESGLLFGLISLVTVPASLAFGYIGSRLRARRLVLVAVAIAIGVAGVGMLVTSNFWLLAFFCALMGGAWGYVPIAFAIPYEIEGTNPQEIAVGSALINGLLFAGGVVGPALVGTLSDLTGSLFAALLASALIPFAMAPLVLGIKDRPRAAKSIEVGA